MQLPLAWCREGRGRRHAGNLPYFRRGTSGHSLAGLQGQSAIGVWRVGPPNVGKLGGEQTAWFPA